MKRHRRRNLVAVAPTESESVRIRHKLIIFFLAVVVSCAGFVYTIRISRATGSLAAELPPGNDSGLRAASTMNGFQPTVENLRAAPAPAPKGMAWIPGGEFSMGANDPPDPDDVGMKATADSRPRHRVYVDGFFMDKTEGTSANIFTDREVHGNRQGTNNTYKSPGQAFTDEWGLGQILPLKKNLSQLLQVGVVGYDQWQITDNGGTVPIGPVIAPAKFLPYYSVHGVGGQLNYILPARNFSLFFKYYHEYKSYSAALGNTVVFGGFWSLPIPKPPPPK